jgi:serpin B
MLQLFQAKVEQADSVDVINAWAAEATKGLIKEAIPPGTPFDLVLTNAVYFKGLWDFPFDKADTFDGPFITSTGQIVQVPMMSRTFKSHGLCNNPNHKVVWADNDRYTAIRLPYKDTSISAIAVLPRHTSAIEAEIAKFDVHELLNPASYQPLPSSGVHLYMPRFKVQTRCVSLKQSLIQLGLKTVFDPDKADFSRLSDQPLFISDVLHSVSVIVDEAGTEAAALTICVTMWAGLSPPVIRMDRPFLFMLADNATGTLLFVTTVVDPSCRSP